ncbi:MAG TPA: MFS transporter [Phycisphaerae bacterium]|nr:MFS transporter [Phycisphaerae bacterium]
MNAAEPAKLTFLQQLRSFPGAFWVANSIELIERFSFWGVRGIAALYITRPAEQGALGFTNTDKAMFFGVWAFIQCALPMFTGGFADRYGYRRSLMVAYVINMVGYGLMAFTHSWGGFMLACCLVGTGTAIFKPPLHGTIAHCVNKSNSSVGWGAFYMVVNIGGFIGPLVLGGLRLLEWRYAFFAAASIILLNMLITGLFLKDYSKEARAAGEATRKGPGKIFLESLAALKDMKLTAFLAIFTGFWFMFMQLFDQLSVAIDQWVDSNDVVRTVDALLQKVGIQSLSKFAAEGGQVNPEWIINVDAGAIIVLVLLISYITGKFHPIKAIIAGMFISCIGLLFCGTATTGWFCVLFVFLFALGEMACSPKFSEYVGLMAPPEKKAVYMGHSNIPFAVGWTIANLVGGPIYTQISDKITLARKYMVTHLQMDAQSVEQMTVGQVMPALAEALNVSEAAATQMLRAQYHPEYFWYVCIGVGLLSSLGMVRYHFWLKAAAAKRAAAGS